MRKIVLYAAIAGAALSLSACEGGQEKQPAAESKPAEPILSEAEVTAFKKSIADAKTSDEATKLAIKAKTMKLRTEALTRAAELRKK